MSVAEEYPDPITGKEPQPAPLSPPSVDIPDIPTAPSDELQADAKSISASASIGGLLPVNATKSVVVEPDPAASDEVVKPEDAQSEEPEVLA